MSYMPKEVYSRKTAMHLLVVDHYEKVGGVSKPVYKEAEKPLFYCNFKSMGGTEKVVDGRYVIEDTANITMLYRPDLQSNCRVKKLNNNAIYEIINEPEDIEDNGRWLKFKVKRVKGKA